MSIKDMSILLTSAMVAPILGRIVLFVQYQLSIILTIYTKNQSNLTNRYRKMVPGQTMGQTDEWKQRRHQNYIPPTSYTEK